MSAEFLPEADAEFLEAAAFYEQRQEGLGIQFLEAVESAVADAEMNPRRWPVFARGTRRRLIGRFPYGLIYLETRTGILIVAVMHLHRHPRYWTGRLKKKR
jgi:plasmid stabilization system protein ParE